MFHKPLYRLEGFQHVRKIDFHGHSFDAHLDSGFARKALEKEMSQEQLDRINESGKDIIQGLMQPDRELIDSPYVFYENRLLPYVIRAPGNSCDLGLDGQEQEEFVKGNSNQTITYYHHNIDTLKQKITLLSLFVNWVDIAEALID